MTPNLKRWDHLLNAHLQHAWTRALRDGLDPYIAVEREARIFSLIAVIDPGRGRYLSWLSSWRRRQWDVTGLGVPVALDQVDDLAVALQAFELARPSLPLDCRDVGALRTAGELREVAALGPETARIAREVFVEEALAGSVVLYENPPWKLVQVMTEAAARYWGEETRWCTASSALHFRKYLGLGPLLVLLTPHGLFQFAPASGEFKDARDEPADSRVIFKNAPLALQELLRGL